MENINWLSMYHNICISTDMNEKKESDREHSIPGLNLSGVLFLQSLKFGVSIGQDLEILV